MNWETSFPKEIAGVRVPDTSLVLGAIRLAREVSSPLLFNHCIRTFVFGSLIAEKHSVKYDAEVACVAAVLHDLGLTDHAHGPRRFEVEGADAAKRFALKHEMSEEKAEIVWDAIALHTASGISIEKRMEIALTQIGASVDVFGRGLESISESGLKAVLEQFPRLDFKNGFLELLTRSWSSKPPMVTAFTFGAEICRNHIPGFQCPTFSQAMHGAGFSS
ncbi:HD domain-containing protein [Bradyrhizobium sp.]|uniref:HD domain-containing protein n=1 Tax=Bradyrhizobium sp. TaxID=376 RepID=UPI001DE1FA9C|nr:HD domain-containing protein [Bradyrhizobium sp.]MBI5322444.1 HD domain-containing protein [Bradyrhizobium sp.]